VTTGLVSRFLSATAGKLVGKHLDPATRDEKSTRDTSDVKRLYGSLQKILDGLEEPHPSGENLKETRMRLATDLIGGFGRMQF